MAPCLHQVRRKIQDLTKTLFRDIDDLRIAIVAHGDYCDGKNVITALDFTDSPNKICKFVRDVPSTGGGDWEECYEYVLHEMRGFSWQADTSRALVMIGDAVPHPKSHYRTPLNACTGHEYYDWINEAKLLHNDMRVNVYSVQCLRRRGSRADKFWEGLAEITNGYYLELDQFATMPELLHAVAYKQMGNDRLQQYESTLVDQGRMTRNVDALFATLLGRTPNSGTKGTKAGTKRFKAKSPFSSVDPARFQSLHVDLDTPIKQFVLDNGATFKIGRGFYEFIKPVLVQEKKEVILKDRTTGDLFTGDKAREMIGLPFGERGRVNPKHSDLGNYVAFIQSTSPNRKLLGGTEFLYEVDDWDRA